MKVSNCPRCGHELELDPDGGWCSHCQEYWDNVDLDADEEG
jgi:transposase